MDPKLIGQKIKQAYPQYADRDEMELGTNYLQKYGGAIAAVQSGKIKITDIPEAQRIGVGLGLSAVSPESTGNPIAEVMKQGGADFVNEGKDMSARQAIAEEIVRMGGVKNYRQALPLDSLLNDKERTAVSDKVSLVGDIDRALPNFEKDTLGGTGPLAQYIPGFLRSPEGREKVADVEKVRALYQQMISGKVISDKEAERLKQFLPTKGKTETQNREDLQRLKDSLDLNMKLFDKGKREGLTPNEAYEKYGSQLLNQALGGGTGKSSGRFKIEAIE